MKDRLIHFYLGLDYKLVWQTIEERMPEVKPLFRKVSDSPPLIVPLLKFPPFVTTLIIPSKARYLSYKQDPWLVASKFLSIVIANKVKQSL